MADTRSPLSVLVVEDEAILAVALEMAVQDAGCELAGVAADRSEALRIAEARHIDLALVDINLRDGHTGGDIADRLGNDHGASTLFLTANPEQAPGGLKCNLGVYPKPYDIEEVVDLIHYAADLRSGAPAGPPPRRLRASDWLKDQDL